MADIAPGTRLGVYEIIDAIGAGGMGTVYRARDTRLPRQVAIKVSAERFSHRFSAEAHAIASLNHPNVTTLYDVGPDYLVMELVEGQTLAERIMVAPLTLEEAVHIGRQIADALDYAHEHGIVHRDLKPSNVKIRPDGVVKVLDFGLASAGIARTMAPSDELQTLTAHHTEAGVIVGTLAYMSPEQLAGQPVDTRLDVWAFGCVVYEMLTGTPAYRGANPQATTLRILRDEPDLTRVPAPARRLLKRCLEKNPLKRLRHIGDAMALIDEPPAAEPPALAAARPPSATGARAGARWLWPAVTAIALVAAGAAIWAWAPWRTATNDGRPVRFEVAETEKMKFFYGDFMAVSPDGRWMVFPAKGEDGVNRYWVRSLETVEARPLPGTETAFVPAAWSWDSRWVIFNLLGDNKLYKVDIQGGQPLIVAQIPGALNGATSNRDGEIVFGVFAPNPLFRVRAEGGVVTPLTALTPGETNHRWPQFLPDGRHFLYSRMSSDPDRMGVYVGSVDVKPEAQSPTRVLATNRQAYYAAAPGGDTGHLVFLRDTTLMAQPFDPVRFALAGEPAPIAEGVESFEPATAGMFSVSDTGTLVYRPREGSEVVPMWFDQQGKPSGALAGPGQYANAAVSPDGARVAVARGPAGSRDLWVLDVARGTTTRLTFDLADDDNPVWSPDGRNLAFSSTRTGQEKLYFKPADGSGDERLLTDRPGVPTSWSSDGRVLLFTTAGPGTGNDIWALANPGEAAARPFPVLASVANEIHGQLSPDGRWIAYASNASSSGEGVWVRPFSPDGKAGAAGARWLVSPVGSQFPRWRADGKQLVYASVDALTLMAVEIDTSQGFRAGTPRRLVDTPPQLVSVGWNLTADGRRFLFITTPNGGRPQPFTVVLNWAAGLKQ